MLPNDNRQRQSRDNSWLSLEIYVKANQPELLQGLDRWLELNLISEAQVKKICRQNLTCALPEIKLVETTSDIEQSPLSLPVKTLVKNTPKPNIIGQLWQNFLDELSIRWLLFLGIFLVIVSSGVLAASQWDHFPRLGQYLILLIYTLIFWGIGFWSSKQDNLKLTSQTLSAIATLLIPINFWAINQHLDWIWRGDLAIPLGQFGLGNNILEWIIIVISSITLTATIYLQPQFKHKNNKFFLPLFLLLSYLHLGWSLPLLPLTAVYVSIISISVIYYKLLLPQQQYSLVNLLFLFASWSLLLVRGLSISVVDSDFLFNYALAIALFGWLLSTIYLTQERTSKIISSNEQQQKARQLTNTFLSKVFQTISIIILTFTWLLSLLGGIVQSQLFFWQTVGISALAIHLFTQRLTLYWRKRDLTAIFFIGLQTLYISKELIPDHLRSEALNLAVTVSKTEYFPESVFGVTLFPYVILFVFIATWLYRRQKPQLALYAEFLTLI